MKKCSGNDSGDWEFDSIFEIEYPHCGNTFEFFKDEITRRCPECKSIVKYKSGDYGCVQWCYSSSDHQRSLYSKFQKPKGRSIGRTVF